MPQVATPPVQRSSCTEDDVFKSVATPQIPPWPNPAGGKQQGQAQPLKDEESVAIPQIPPWPNPAGGKQQGEAPPAGLMLVPPWPDDAAVEEQRVMERHLHLEYEARTGKLPRPPEELLAGATTQQQLAELLASEQVADELSAGGELARTILLERFQALPME